MDDKELVEVWQSEFESLDELRSFIFDKDDFGRYTSSRTDGRWQGFLLAKRTQPSVVLPKGFLMDDPDGMGRGRYLMVESVERSINRAGIKYTIGE